jgi:hypothetical protein
VNDKLYVTFADLLNPAGGGGGAVDVFDTAGNFQDQLDANGPGPGRLQNPWGVTQAPANFGAYSNDLLVGNVAGAGNINAYDPATGAYLGQLRQPNGAPIAIKGLWDMDFGEGTPHGGKTNELFFDAGPNHPGDSTGGLLGVIRAAGGHHKDPYSGPNAILASSLESSPPKGSQNLATPTSSSSHHMNEHQMVRIHPESGRGSKSSDSHLNAMYREMSRFHASSKSNPAWIYGLHLDGLDPL